MTKENNIFKKKEVNVIDKIRRDIVRLNKSTNISEERLDTIESEIKSIKDSIKKIEESIESLIERSGEIDDTRKSGILSFFK